MKGISKKPIESLFFMDANRFVRTRFSMKFLRLSKDCARLSPKLHISLPKRESKTKKFFWKAHKQLFWTLTTELIRMLPRQIRPRAAHPLAREFRRIILRAFWELSELTQHVSAKDRFRPKCLDAEEAYGKSDSRNAETNTARLQNVRADAVGLMRSRRAMPPNLTVSIR